MGEVRTRRFGDLTVQVWPGRAADAPVVLAAHGITANGLAWARVAELLDGEVTVVAPDLRGRGGSRGAGGPYGIGRHADDLIGLLDALGAQRAVLTGHSMGAYCCTVAAARHPERVSGLVLVDGGLAFPVPAGVDVDQILHAIIGPAMERLSMTFPDRDAYRRYWRQHPALAEDWNRWLDDYLQYDLVGDGPYRASSVIDAIRVDGGQVVSDDETLRAIHELRVPAVLLWAQRGIMNQPEGLYTPQRLAGLGVRTVAVPDTNHYSILTGERGARAVADELRAAAGLPAPGGRPDSGPTTA